MFTINPFSHDPRTDRQRIRVSFYLAAAFVALLWSIKLVETIGGVSLLKLGIFPGSAQGLVGIVFAPLIHGSYAHLLANTPPLLILGTTLLYAYPRAARIAVPTIYLGTGVCVWLLGRAAWHIGASGLTFGFLLFVFTIGIIRRDRKAIALSLLVFFLYGGMLAGVIPGRQEISFESHLAGAFIGLVMAFILKNSDPPAVEKRYSWEDENEEEDDTGPEE